MHSPLRFHLLIASAAMLLAAYPAHAIRLGTVRGSIDRSAQIVVGPGDTRISDPAAQTFEGEGLGFATTPASAGAFFRDPNADPMDPFASPITRASADGTFRSSAPNLGPDSASFNGSLRVEASATAREPRFASAGVTAFAEYGFELFGPTRVVFFGVNDAGVRNAGINGVARSTASIRDRSGNTFFTAQRRAEEGRLEAGTYFVQLQADAFTDTAVDPNDPFSGLIGQFNEAAASPNFSITLTSIPEPAALTALAAGGPLLLRRRAADRGGERR